MNRNADREARQRFLKDRAKWESIPWSTRKAQRIVAYWTKKLGPNFDPRGPMPPWRGTCSRDYVEDMIFLLGFPGLDAAAMIAAEARKL